MRILAVFIACLSIAAISISSVAAVGTVDSFRLVQHYSSPTGGAEIVAASPDGMTLAYSDATSGSVGFLDITDPADMSFLGAIETAGEPSSAAFSPDGEWVFAAVKTYVREEGAPANLTPGLLYVIDAD
ncbi:MAG TPA: hypothetical protein VFK32_02355, partial [Tepidiformaceae bacterium]|nr:hypothetical protein [Tepidiformaceae bacterium]